MKQHPVRVYFEDTDFTGRVYHGAFVRFLERGRTEFLRASGIDHAALACGTPPLFFTLRGMTLAFAGPAFIDDLLTVETVPTGTRKVLFTMAQRILREDRAIVTATVELCLIDPAGRPSRPPAAVAARLTAA